MVLTLEIGFLYLLTRCYFSLFMLLPVLLVFLDTGWFVGFGNGLFFKILFCFLDTDTLCFIDAWMVDNHTKIALNIFNKRYHSV